MNTTSDTPTGADEHEQPPPGADLTALAESLALVHTVQKATKAFCSIHTAAGVTTSTCALTFTCLEAAREFFDLVSAVLRAVAPPIVDSAGLDAAISDLFTPLDAPGPPAPPGVPPAGDLGIPLIP